MIPIKVVSTQDSNVLQVRYFPTDICNFNCSYCFPGAHDAKYRYPKNTNLVIENFKKLFDMYSNNLGKTKFHLVISGGGEPTMWPDLENFCSKLKESFDVYVTLVTNGSRTLRWWKENINCFDDVVLSCHNEFVDIDHHIEVGDLLFSAGVKVTALMVMDAKNWDKCESYIDRMQTSKYPWFIEAKPVVDAPGHGMDIYSKHQIEYINKGIKRIPDSEWILKHLDELRSYESVVLFSNDSSKAMKQSDIITNRWNYFEGWDCNIGFEAIAIAASGGVSGSCRLSPFNKSLNVLDEIFDTTTEINKVRCTHKECTCQPDTHVTKSKPINFI
jgi:organic radical activating enzyme